MAWQISNSLCVLDHNLNSYELEKNKITLVDIRMPTTGDLVGNSIKIHGQYLLINRNLYAETISVNGVIVVSDSGEVDVDGTIFDTDVSGTATGPFSISYTYYLTKFANLVVCHLPAFPLTATTSATALSFPTIPLDYRPLYNNHYSGGTLVNGTTVATCLRVITDGSLILSKDTSLTLQSGQNAQFLSGHDLSFFWIAAT